LDPLPGDVKRSGAGGQGNRIWIFLRKTGSQPWPVLTRERTISLSKSAFFFFDCDTDNRFADNDHDLYYRHPKQTVFLVPIS
jgi:hypothetical protein